MRRPLDPTRFPVLVDREQLHTVFGITLSLAEIARREDDGLWPPRVKAGRHPRSRVYYYSADIIELIAWWEDPTKPPSWYSPKPRAA